MTIPVGGPVDPDQHMLVVRPVSAWVAQYREADEAIRTANGGADPADLNAAAEIAPVAFTNMIEALVALEPLTGRKVGADLISLAGLVPVDQALME